MYPPASASVRSDAPPAQAATALPDAPASGGRSGSVKPRSTSARDALTAKKNRRSSRNGARSKAPRMPAAALVQKPVVMLSPADTDSLRAREDSTAARRRPGGRAGRALGRARSSAAD